MNHSNVYVQMLAYMIITSIILGYILMTILLSENKTINLNKIYQALLMGSTMGLASVWIMDVPDKAKLPWTIVLGVASALLIVAIRNQTFIYEQDFARGMIEHHEMAIVMAKELLQKPDVQDSFIRNLASNILTTQTQEIDQMKQWLDSQETTKYVNSNM